jgi:hypothetical protein
LTVTAYRAGENYGTAVTAPVLATHDPGNYVILADNDYTMDPDGLQDNIDYNAYLIAQGDSVEVSGEDADTNMARITLHPVQLPPSLQNTGTLTITLSNPASVRLFDSDGELLSPADLTIDLSAPTGLLAGLANGDEDIYAEGLTANPDLTITYAYKGTGTGSAVTGSTVVHMAVADLDFVANDGTIYDSIPGDIVQQELDQSSSEDSTIETSDPGAITWQGLVDTAGSQGNAFYGADEGITEAEFRLHVGGLSSTQIGELTIAHRFVRRE